MKSPRSIVLGDESERLVQTFRRIARRRQVGTDLLERLGKDPKAVKKLMLYKSYAVIWSLCRVPNLPEDVVDFLLGHYAQGVRLQAAQFSPLTIEQMMGILKLKGEKWALLQRDDLPLEIQKLLAKDEEHYTVVGLASNRNLDYSIVKGLAKHEYSGVRAAIASRTDLREEEAALLAADNEVAVRKAVATSSSLPLNEIVHLGTDSQEVVKKLAKNPKLPENLQLELAGSVEGIAFELASSQNELSDAVLEKLLENSSEKVRFTVVKRKNLTQQLLQKATKDSNYPVRRRVAARPDLQEDTVKELVKDKNLRVRAVLAGNRKIPYEYLSSLDTDRSVLVRNAIANRKGAYRANEESLYKLIEDKDTRVAKRVFSNSIGVEGLERRYFTRVAGELWRAYNTLPSGVETSFTLRISKRQDFSRKSGNTSLGEEILSWSKQYRLQTDRSWNFYLKTREFTEGATIMPINISPAQEGKLVVPFGWKDSSGKDWFLFKNKVGKWIAQLPENFDGWGGIIEPGSVVSPEFSCPISLGDGIARQWAVEMERVPKFQFKSIPNFLSTYKEGFTRISKKSKRTNIEISLRGIALAYSGIYALWEDGIGEVGWTLEETANLPKRKLAKAKDFINSGRYELIDNFCKEFRELLKAEIAL